MVVLGMLHSREVAKKRAKVWTGIIVGNLEQMPEVLGSARSNRGVGCRYTCLECHELRVNNIFNFDLDH